jgi:hypothetical protein
MTLKRGKVVGRVLKDQKPLKVEFFDETDWACVHACHIDERRLG